MASKRTQTAFPGGDALTWVLLLGVGGFALVKGIEEYQERENAKKAASAAPCGCTGAK